MLVATMLDAPAEVLHSYTVTRRILLISIHSSTCDHHGSEVNTALGEYCRRLGADTKSGFNSEDQLRPGTT